MLLNTFQTVLLRMNVSDEERANFTTFPILQCGGADLDEAGVATFKACSFWVEGVAMSVLGLIAVITNFISIYVFTR